MQELHHSQHKAANILGEVPCTLVIESEDEKTRDPAVVV